MAAFGRPVPRAPPRPWPLRLPCLVIAGFSVFVSSLVEGTVAVGRRTGHRRKGVCQVRSYLALVS